MEQSIILLTYKGKVLLVHKDYVLATLDQNPWRFISGIKEKHESFEETIYREVKRAISIQLSKIQFLGKLINRKQTKYFYHSHLTDGEVNNITHLEGEILGFYSLRELDSLLLAVPTRLLLQRHSSFINAHSWS